MDGAPDVRPEPRGRFVRPNRPAVIEIALDAARGEDGSVVRDWAEPALLESAPGFGEAGRWSIRAARPRLVFEATGQHWSVRGEHGPDRRGAGDVLDELSALLTEFRLADPSETPEPDAPPFRGVMIGFFGYDL